MECIRVSPNGKCDSRKVTKKSLAQKFDLHSRDLRPVIFPRQLFTISVRSHRLIVNLESLKIILSESRAYLLETQNKKHQEMFLEQCSERLRQKTEEDKTPFELLVLEIALDFCIHSMHNDFDMLNTQIQKNLKLISDKPGQGLFEELLILKKKISRLEKSAQELQSALDEIINDEDEMNEFCTAVGGVNIVTLDEIEYILENPLDQALELLRKLSEVKENIDDTQEIITLQLSSTRNTMIQLDLLISFGTAVLGLGTLIAGFYGMNVRNHFEDEEWFFYLICGGVLFFSFLFFILFWLFVRRKNLA